MLSQHPPSPLGGGTAGKDTTEWTRSLNDAAIPAFKGVASIDDYLAAQERLISQDPYRRARPLPSLPYQAGRSVVLGEQPKGSETGSGPAELLTVDKLPTPVLRLTKTRKICYATSSRHCGVDTDECHAS